MVDDDDFDLVSKRKWHAHLNTNKVWYARSFVRKGVFLPMHRLVMPEDNNKIHIDHINRNGLDNRRVNLRKATISQNLANRGIGPKNTSGYKGVSFSKSITKPWRARIKFGSVHRCVYFKNVVDAALTYDAWAKEAHGEYAGLNFP